MQVLLVKLVILLPFEHNYLTPQVQVREHASTNTLTQVACWANY